MIGEQGAERGRAAARVPTLRDEVDEAKLLKRANRHGDTGAAVNQLEALLHELDAMDNKRLSAVDANPLRAAVAALIASLSG